MFQCLRHHWVLGLLNCTWSQDDTSWVSRVYQFWKSCWVLFFSEARSIQLLQFCTSFELESQNRYYCSLREKHYVCTPLAIPCSSCWFTNSSLLSSIGVLRWSSSLTLKTEMKKAKGELTRSCREGWYTYTVLL